MSYRTILVHCDASEAVAHRLGVAVTLANKHDAHLVGLYTRPQFEPPILFDGGFSMGRYYTAFEDCFLHSAANGLISVANKLARGITSPQLP